MDGWMVGSTRPSNMHTAGFPAQRTQNKVSDSRPTR